MGARGWESKERERGRAGDSKGGPLRRTMISRQSINNPQPASALETLLLQMKNWHGPRLLSPFFCADTGVV